MEIRLVLVNDEEQIVMSKTVAEEPHFFVTEGLLEQMAEVLVEEFE